MLTGTRVDGLLLRDGRASPSGAARGRRELPASAVVLAAGGFQADTQLLAEHVGPAASGFLARAVAHDVGDGLRLARSAGAASTPSMKTIYGHLMPAPCRISWTSHTDPILLSAFYAAHGVVLNVGGERFVDEGAGELNGETINAAARQPAGRTVDRSRRRNPP